MTSHDLSRLAAAVDAAVGSREAALVSLRRDLHAHPEPSWAEHRTTQAVLRELPASWRVTQLPGTGLVADLVPEGAEGAPLVALRADLDALPVPDTAAEPWASTVPGVAHACGHDVHTTCLVGAAGALADLAEQGLVPGRLRLLFQPAEESMPGGALRLLEHGHLDGVERVLALHCDPSVDVGRVGLRSGALTSAADKVEVRLTGPGGHTSRPHLTGDLVFALGKVVTELPAVLSRRLDPRSGVSLVWGQVHAGSAPNVIPGHGQVAGTVRILDAEAWEHAEPLVRAAVAEVVAPYAVSAEVDYQRGVPPVVNDPVSHRLLGEVARAVLGRSAVTTAPQSLGAEDFGWLLQRVPGAMFRLGTRTPGGPTYDLHRGDLVVDERAIGVGARMLAAAAVRALRAAAPADPVAHGPV